MDIKLLYGFINFAIFLGGLIYLLRPTLAEFLLARHQSTHDEIEKISRITRQTEKRFEEYRKRLSNLNEEVAHIQQLIKKEGEHEKEKIIAQSKKYAENIKKDAAVVAGQELIKARLHLRKNVALQALSIANQVIQERINENDQQQLIKTFVSELKKNHERASIS